jgi:hypothetical protein
MDLTTLALVLERRRRRCLVVALYHVHQGFSAMMMDTVVF